MIEAFLLYLISIGISYLEDYINYYRVLYEINKQGTYVVPGLFDVAYKKTIGIKTIEMLIPIYNILKPIYQSTVIPNKIELIYDALSKSDALELMESDKIKELEETPTLAKTMELTNKHEKEINNYSRIAFNDYSIMYFDANDESISRIKRVIGPLSHEDGFTKYKRLMNALEYYKVFLEVVYKNGLTDEEMEKLLKSQFNFDLRGVDDTISVEEFREGLQEAYQEALKTNKVERETKTLKRLLKK